MRKEDLLWNLWMDLCAAYREAGIDLVKAIQAAKTPEDGLSILDRYNAVHLDFARSLVFATEDRLRAAFLNGLVELKALGYVKLPAIDRRVQAFFEGKAERPFVDE